MGKKLNVLELCLTLDTGGLEKIVVSLSNALAGRENVSPNICTVGRTSGEVLPASIQEGVGWFELKGPPYFDFKTAWRLLGLVRKRKINLIHAHGTQPLVYALSVSLATGVPVLLTKHSSFEDLQFFERRRLFHALACHRSGYFIGVSPQATQVLKRVFAPVAHRCMTQINGTALIAKPVSPRFSFESEDVLQRPLIITTVCRLSPEKDLVTLLRAFARLSVFGPKAELWIVGDGVESNQLRHSTTKLGVAEKVRFFGVSGQVEKLLLQSHIFANSSLTEGISVAILEAMSAGLPVVATSVGGTPSIVKAGYNGLLVPAQNEVRMAEALLHLMQRPGLRAEMGANGRKEIEAHWSLERMAGRYLELYHQLHAAHARA